MLGKFLRTIYKKMLTVVQLVAVCGDAVIIDTAGLQSRIAIIIPHDR